VGRTDRETAYKRNHHIGSADSNTLPICSSAVDSNHRFLFSRSVGLSRLTEKNFPSLLLTALASSTRCHMELLFWFIINPTCPRQEHATRTWRDNYEQKNSNRGRLEAVSFKPPIDCRPAVRDLRDLSRAAIMRPSQVIILTQCGRLWCLPGQISLYVI